MSGGRVLVAVLAGAAVLVTWSIYGRKTGSFGVWLVGGRWCCAWSLTCAFPPSRVAQDVTKPVVVVTGGAGFIGSHTIVQLLTAG